MEVRVVDHPLAVARLTTLRDERTDNAGFRAALRDLTAMLVYEATRDAARETFPIRTPLAETLGVRLANPPLLVPVLRAGLGMVDQALALLPEARVGFVGVARDEETHQADGVSRVAARRPDRPAGDGPRPDAGHRRVDDTHDRSAAAPRRNGHHGVVRGGRTGRHCAPL